VNSSRKSYYYFRANSEKREGEFVEQLSDHQHISKSYIEVGTTYQLSLPEK